MSSTSNPGSPAAPIDPSTIRIAVARACRSFANNGEAAAYWCDFGLQAIAVVQGEKFSVRTWSSWLADYSREKVLAEWAAHPSFEVGCIVGSGLIVLDADSEVSQAALQDLERRFNVRPTLVVRTRKGVHHYFRLAPDTFAKSDSHSTELYPHRIDIKAGRALVVLPPSGGREVLICNAQSTADLPEVGQDFVDAVNAHNGREPPRKAPIAPAPGEPQGSKVPAKQLAVLLDFLDPDTGYEDWLHILMAVFHETSGSDEGLKLATEWSSGGKKFKGHAEIEGKWRSFNADHPNPVTIGSLIHAVQQQGIDWQEALAAAEPPFEQCDYEVIDKAGSVEAPASPHPLARYSMLGRSSEVQQQLVAQQHVLGQIAISGQATVFYAAPNTGKTLITLALLTEAVRRGRIAPGQLYYVNVDDTAHGLLDKLRIAEEYGFHMLSEGYREFNARDLPEVVAALTSGEYARGCIIVLDTMKKFVDLMDKARASRFTAIMRRFVLHGGTVIALAHTNKHPRPDGTPIYAGTTDVVDDFDCAYTLQQVAVDDKTKVVRFENFKRRGNAAQTVAYSYSVERGQPYDELLLSVREIDETQLLPIIQAEALRTDAELIDAVLACITAGINTKMRLVQDVSERMRASRREVLVVLDRYTGDDPGRYRWRFKVRDRGAKVYEALPPAFPATDPQA